MIGCLRAPAISLAAILLPSMAAGQSALPCESYSRSAAVFVGSARAPVKRIVQLAGNPPVEMTLTPIEVERAYLGVITRIVYISGVETYAVPNRRYLVYGGAYRPPDVVVASPDLGVKEVEKAEADIAFLESLPAASTGSTITGTVAQKELVYGGTSNVRTRLAGISVRIFNKTHTTEALTDTNGQFVASGLPSGRYQLSPRLPDNLVVVDPTSRIEAVVRDRGCASVGIDVVFNGRVRGVLRGPDSRPLPSTTVDLMPTDIAPDPRTGRIRGTSSVSTNEDGEFEFTGRPPGRYYLGVSLYNPPFATGPSYPRTYYPGTTDRASAIPITIDQQRVNDVFDFSIPTVLGKGVLEFVVETPHEGKLTVCYIQPETPGRRISHSVEPGLTYRRDVVDGQRYEIHIHLEYPGGHMESEPFIFTATTGKITVTLRPDAPRDLHR